MKNVEEIKKKKDFKISNRWRKKNEIFKIKPVEEMEKKRQDFKMF